MAQEAPPPLLPPDPLVGRVLGGHYRIEARIGGGAMGSVYRARHSLLDQDFAVKVLAREVADDPDVRRRFLLEARSLTLFAHKNAVQVRHLGEDQGLLYLAMDLCPGRTLAVLLEEEGTLPPRRAAAIAIQILDALDEAHLAGIVHRDMKPGNVMVETVPVAGGEAVDRVRVVDFGLARIVDAERATLPAAYQSTGGNVVGTVAYMSPEQLRAEEDVDGRSDLFSVGIVLYECLCGRLPFAGTSTMSLAVSILEHDPEPLPEFEAGLPSGPLGAVIARALEKDPDRRFQTGAEFAAALRGALEGHAPPPRHGRPAEWPASESTPPRARASEAPAPRAAAPSSSRRWRKLALAAAVLALGAGASWLVTRGSGPTAPDAAASPWTAALLDGRWGEAVTLLAPRVASGRATGEDYLDRATARIELEDPNAASDLEAAASRLPEDARVPLLEGRLAWKVQKDDAKADKAFAQALLRDPTRVDTRLERVRWRVARGKLPEARMDVEALERDAGADPWTAIARSEYEVALGFGVTGAEALRHDEAAAAALDAAIQREPHDAELLLARASVWSARAYAARRAEDHDTSRASLTQAEALCTRAFELAGREPAHRRQGMERGRILRLRGSVRYERLDYDGSAEDFEQVLARAPRDPEILSLSLFANRNRGRYDDVIRDGQRLYELTGKPEPLFDVGYAHQALGEDRAEVSDVEGAHRELDLAIETYGKGAALGPKSTMFPTYRAEAHVLRARLSTGAERADHLAKARADFDTALSLNAAQGNSAPGEILLRRSAMHAVAGEAEMALEDAERALAETSTPTTRYELTVAIRLVVVADREARAGRVEEARTHLRRAVDAATKARERTPAAAFRALPIAVTALARRAALAPDAAARTLELAAATDALTQGETAAAAEKDEHARAVAALSMARAELLLAQGDAKGAAATAASAVASREADAKAARWYEDALWVDRLAELLDAAGDKDAAAAARAHAASLLR